MFDLDSTAKERLARALSLRALSPEIAAAIADAVACFKATRNRSPDTTVGNTSAALGELSPTGPTYNPAVARLATDLSGVDYTTLGRVQQLAVAVLAGDHQANLALQEAAQVRSAELRDHPRVMPKTEALRFFCGWLRVIFDGVASPTLERTWHNCGTFALEVFSVAEIEHADFDAHPERLKEYLGTDITCE